MLLGGQCVCGHGHGQPAAGGITLTHTSVTHTHTHTQNFSHTHTVSLIRFQSGQPTRKARAVLWRWGCEGQVSKRGWGCIAGHCFLRTLFLLLCCPSPLPPFPWTAVVSRRGTLKVNTPQGQCAPPLTALKGHQCFSLQPGLRGHLRSAVVGRPVPGPLPSV